MTSLSPSGKQKTPKLLQYTPFCLEFLCPSNLYNLFFYQWGKLSQQILDTSVLPSRFIWFGLSQNNLKAGLKT